MGVSQQRKRATGQDADLKCEKNNTRDEMRNEMKPRQEGQLRSITGWRDAEQEMTSHSNMNTFVQ